MLSICFNKGLNTSFARNLTRVSFHPQSASNNTDTPRKNQQEQTDKKEKLEQSKAPVQEENGEYVNPTTGERNGPRGPEPTRYGDWVIKGRVTDF